MDAFREKAIAAHAKDWRFLAAAAQSYAEMRHFGVIISGQFKRGTNRNGDGAWKNSLDRDRTRALQLMDQAVGLMEALNGRSRQLWTDAFVL